MIDRNDFTHFGPKLTGADSIQSARNDAFVLEDWNTAAYRGARVSVAWDINDDWDALVQHTAQTMDSQGSFLVEPHLGYESSASFQSDYNRDDFGLTTWTLNGRIAKLELIYTGGSLDRSVDALVDYTHYNNGGGYITYYLCSGNIFDLTDPNHCFDPTKWYTEGTTNRRSTHEFRVHTSEDRRVRVLGGVYFNDVETSHIGDFRYASTNRAFGEHANNYYNDNRGDDFMVGNITVPTDGVNTMGPRGPSTTFLNDFTRTEEELAVFGEIAFDLNDTMSLSLSARSYDLNTQLAGASNFSFGCRYGIGGFGNFVHRRRPLQPPRLQQRRHRAAAHSRAIQRHRGRQRDPRRDEPRRRPEHVPRRRRQRGHSGGNQERKSGHQRPECRRVHR